MSHYFHTKWVENLITIAANDYFLTTYQDYMKFSVYKNLKNIYMLAVCSTLNFWNWIFLGRGEIWSQQKSIKKILNVWNF